MVLFITLACVCNQFAHAQSTDENISLTITDRNGQALPYATVIVESAGLTYTADAQGRLATCPHADWGRWTVLPVCVWRLPKGQTGREQG